MTMAVLTLLPEAVSSAAAVARSQPVASAMMRWARSTSLALVGRTLTMRLPKVMPERTMTPVESMFRTSLVAVPALRRVLPVRTSGPVAGVMAMSAAWARAEFGTQLRPMVSAPRDLAWAMAPRT